MYRLEPAEGVHYVPAGGEVRAFDEDGRHIRSLDSATGNPITEFDYDAEGRVEAVHARNARGVFETTTFDFDTAGEVRVLGPRGHETVLQLDADGRLVSVDGPGEDPPISLGYLGNTLLLSSFTDARGNQSTFTWDPAGYLLRDESATGGYTELVHRDDPPETGGYTGLLGQVLEGDGFTVTLTTAEGRDNGARGSRSYRVARDGDTVIRTRTDHEQTASAQPSVWLPFSPDDVGATTRRVGETTVRTGPTGRTTTTASHPTSPTTLRCASHLEGRERRIAHDRETTVHPEVRKNSTAIALKGPHGRLSILRVLRSTDWTTRVATSDYKRHAESIGVDNEESDGSWT